MRQIGIIILALFLSGGIGVMLSIKEGPLETTQKIIPPEKEIPRVTHKKPVLETTEITKIEVILEPGPQIQKPPPGSTIFKIFNSIFGFLIISLLLAGGVGLYFLPAILAEEAKHKNRNTTVVLNILLGWTIIGWIVLLYLTIQKKREVKTPSKAIPHI